LQRDVPHDGECRKAKRLYISVMQKLNFALLLATYSLLGSGALCAQNSAIDLLTEISTTNYTDGTSKSNARLLFVVNDGVPQSLGFMGRKLKPHLNEADIVQEEFASFRKWGAASLALGGTFTVTLIDAVFAEEIDPAPGQGEISAAVASYKWAIASGAAYLAAGFIAQQKLNAVIEQHNMVLSPTLSANGVGLNLKF
jgi:hypothetical protein